MKTLIVAHPDDEIIWFDAQMFDKIVIVFLADENGKLKEERKKALLDHPLRDRIVCLGIKETENAGDLFSLLPEHIDEATEIWTHNPWGEYGHIQHKLVYQVVKEITDKPIYCNMIDKNEAGEEYYNRKSFEIKFDNDFFEKVKKIYVKNKCWTGFKKYDLPIMRKYFKVN